LKIKSFPGQKRRFFPEFKSAAAVNLLLQRRLRMSFLPYLYRFPYHQHRYEPDHGQYSAGRVNCKSRITHLLVPLPPSVKTINLTNKIGL
jgi:hypothetical protein